MSQKLTMKIMLNEKRLKNRKIVFAYVSEHCASVGTKKLSTFGGGWRSTWTSLGQGLPHIEGF